MALQKLLNVREAAEVLGVSAQHLNRLRITGDGPNFVKFYGSRRVNYDPADLAEYIQANKRRSTSDVEGQGQ